MENYKNKYRIPSARLQSWDYRWCASYFITICTQKRLHCFGEIVDGEIQLSHIGILADVFWYEIINHTKNIILGEYVVMPNHVHGILNIVGSNNVVDPVEKTLHATSLRDERDEKMALISPKSDSISAIIRSYKSAITKHAHRLGYEFAWQTRFHDHIIRSEKSYNQITEYVINNPQNWKNDIFHPNCEIHH